MGLCCGRNGEYAGKSWTAGFTDTLHHRAFLPSGRVWKFYFHLALGKPDEPDLVAGGSKALRECQLPLVDSPQDSMHLAVYL